MYFNGSLDHMWLLLFNFFPLSIIPSIFVAFDWIKQGKGGDVLDNSIVSIGLVNFIIPLLLEYITYIPEKPKLLLSGAFHQNNLSRCSDKANLNRSLLKSAIITMFTSILPYLIGIIPYLGQVLTAIGTISPFMGSLIEALLRFSAGCLIVLMMNMWDNTYNTQACNNNPQIFYVVLSIIVALVSNLTTDMLGLVESKLI